MISEKNHIKEFISEALKTVIEDMSAGESVISRYFSPDYVQYVDGQVLNYQDFLKHMAKQKTMLKSAIVSVERCIAEGNAVSTVHHVQAAKKDGSVIEAKVIAHFHLKDGRIVLCDELTKILKGSKEDQNLGSCR